MKVLIISFEESETEILEDILKYINIENDIIEYSYGEKETMIFEGLCINTKRREVFHNNKLKNLTYTEFEILLLLAQNNGMVFSKEQIYNRVWKEPYFGDHNIVMSHIRNLRGKIEDNPSKPIYIQTVWGVGYRFNKNLSSGL